MEIAGAVNWYELQQKGLGRRFLAQFRATAARLRQNPFLYQILESEIRRVVLHRFPYGIFYAIEDHAVVVLACLHTSRDPETWRSRIRLI